MDKRKKEIDIIDFSGKNSGKGADILVPEFVDSNSRSHHEKKVHKTDFVLPLSPAYEGYPEKNSDARRTREIRENQDKKARKSFRWDRLVLFILLLVIALCAWLVYKDFNSEEKFDSAAAVAPLYEEGLTRQGGANSETGEAVVHDDIVVAYEKDNNVICLDAGHGGDDPGAEYKKIYEKDQVLDVTFLVKAFLEEDGYEVVLTRDADMTLSLEDRVNIAEAANAGVLVSIHRNFYQRGELASGVECWINNSNPADAAKLADMILTEINKLGLSDNRGVRMGTISDENKNYKINRSKCTSCIVELGFITNKNDDALVTTNKEDCARAIAAGISGYVKSL